VVDDAGFRERLQSCYASATPTIAGAISAIPIVFEVRDRADNLHWESRPAGSGTECGTELLPNGTEF